MAKILGYPLYGSKSPGRVFGTSFVIYASPYGHKGGYHRVRKFSPKTGPVPTFFFRAQKHFARFIYYWGQAYSYYQNLFTSWASDTPKSGLECCLDDSVYIEHNPFTLSTPPLQGDLELTEFEDYIRVRWKCLTSAFQTGTDSKTLFLYYAENQEPTKDNAHRLQIRKFIYYESGYYLRINVLNHYGASATLPNKYKFEICSARIFCSQLSPTYTQTP